MDSTLIGVIIVALLVIVALALFLRFVPIGLWISAYFSGVKISIGTLVGMRFRRVKPNSIINPLIKATKAGLVLNLSLIHI